VGFDSYQREVAFRSFDGKTCPFCHHRRYGMRVFCESCEKKLSVGVLKGLRNKPSFVWAYYKALDELEELEERELENKQK
jgi:hypothetical protein